jgi:hypothetical protein
VGDAWSGYCVVHPLETLDSDDVCPVCAHLNNADLDEDAPSAWEWCRCGHLALHHEADEHGMREGCVVTVEAHEDRDVQCECRAFEDQREVRRG